MCLAALGVWIPAIAIASPPISLAPSVERLGSSGQETAIYQVHATAGNNGAAFGLEYEPSGWPTAPHVLGSPIAIREIRLNGAGNIRRARTGLVHPASLKIQLGCRRALPPERWFRQYWIEMPADSSSVIELEAEGTFPAWPGARYALELSTFPNEALLEPSVPLATLTTSSLAPRGVHIQMHAVSGSSSDSDSGRTPRMVGTTSPRAPLTRLALRLVRPTKSGGISLGQWDNKSSIPLPPVETDRAGRFEIPSAKVGAEGRFSVLARVRERPGKTAADWNCGPFLSLP